MQLKAKKNKLKSKQEICDCEPLPLLCDIIFLDPLNTCVGFVLIYAVVLKLDLVLLFCFWRNFFSGSLSGFSSGMA